MASKRRGESGHSRLAPGLGGKASSFSPLGVACAARRLEIVFIQERRFLFTLSLLRVFITERALDFVECCSCIFWLDHVIFLS